MNRKHTDTFKNKNPMARSFIRKFVLVLAVFVMMVTTAHAGTYHPFLTNGGTTQLGNENFVINMNRGTTLDYWNGFGYEALDDAYTGVYIGTIDKTGNPSPDDLKNLINTFLGYYPTFEGNVKVNYSATTNTENNLTLTLTYDKDDSTKNYTGTWKVTNSSGTDEKISFYNVKKQNFALYYIEDPGASEGNYTTEHVAPKYDLSRENPSNLQFFKINLPAGGSDPVPEPATMLLFGFSLIGLAGMARRKNSKF